MNLHQKIIAILKNEKLVDKKAGDAFTPECVRAWQTYCYNKGGKFAMFANRFPTEEILPLEVKLEIDNLVNKPEPKKVEKKEKVVNVTENEQTKEESKPVVESKVEATEIKPETEKPINDINDEKAGKIFKVFGGKKKDKKKK